MPAQMLSPAAHDLFLAPLVRLTARHPALEGQVLWAVQGADGWQVQDDSAELLDGEEIPFYVEGLVLEGFGLVWQAMAETGAARREPDHVLILVWEPGATPPPAPVVAQGWQIVAEARWDAAGTRAT